MVHGMVSRIIDRISGKLLNPRALCTLLILLIGLTLSTFLHGLNMIGQTFQGFGVHIPLQVSPVFFHDWPGTKAHLKPMSRIRAVNGIPVKNIWEFDQVIQQMNPYETVYYSLTDGKSNLHQVPVPTTIFSIFDFSRTFGCYLLIALVHIATAAFMLWRKADSHQARQVILFTLITGLTAAVFPDDDYVHAYGALYLIAIVLYPASLLHLALTINRYTLPMRKQVVLVKANFVCFAIWLGLQVGGLLWFMTDMNQPGRDAYNWLYESHTGVLAFSFIAFIALVVYSYCKTSSESLEKRQSRLMLIGAILTFTPIVVFLYVPYFLGYQPLVSGEWFLMALNLFPLFIIYAMVRYQSFDVEIYVRKALVYYASTVILMMIYWATVFLIGTRLFSQSQDFSQVPQMLVLFAAFAVTFRLQAQIQWIIDKMFYRDKINLQHALEDFSQVCSATINKHQLAETCLAVLEKTLHPKTSALYLSHTSPTFTVLASAGQSFPEALTTLEMPAFFRLNIPIQREKTILGWICLGEKHSEVGYFPDELQFLEQIALFCGLALKTALALEEVVTLSVKNAELANKEKLLHELTRNLSHDLKSPLSSCHAILNKLLFVFKDQDVIPVSVMHTHLQKCKKNLDKLYSYISFILDQEIFMQHGYLPLNIEIFDIKLVCQDILNLHEDRLTISGLHVNASFTPEPLIIRGDRQRLEHTLSNLIGNACSYAHSWIQLSLEKNSHEAFIRLADDGPGLPPEVQKNMFEPYPHGASAPQHRKSGSGLGLWLCKQYIDLMQGHIWFETAESGGTLFFITFPLCLQPPDRASQL